MIKFLTLLFILSSCGLERNDKQIKPKPVQVVQSSQTLDQLNQEKQEIDIMVAFLWPQDLDQPQIQKAIKNIISIGRFLRSQGDLRLEKLHTYNKYECEAVLIGDITVEPEIEDLCYDLSDEIDEMALTLFSKVQEMKKEVLSIKGEWLDTFHDVTVDEKAYIELNKDYIFFPALGATTNNGEVTPMSYEIKNTELSVQPEFIQLNANWPNKLGAGEYQAEMAIRVQKYSTVFQGELNLITSSQTRQGLIYWQVLK
ncbi:MAG: hypothetical protein CME62_12295 [Halobacteriovoraceae bacterium]|nr:hypothetical protein [Halobacteriovoraceae bacterium]|tara:strand:- start:4503 stop:5270 length:768 start_codon:yes stop_codon:yes gene_type:complete